MKNLIDVKKHSSSVMNLIATVQLKKYGVECYFENAATAIALGASRSEVLEGLKKDIDKTAGNILRAQPIIHSIQNGVVTEFDSIYNSVEEVFGSCYDKEKEIITLSGISFDLNNSQYYTKSAMSEQILKNLFDIERKELNAVLKTLSKYEAVKTDIERAILYPSTILADEIISKVAAEDVKFESFRKEMSDTEKEEFDKTFKRTGVTGVIQNSTYIDAKGVKQLAPSHKQKDTMELTNLLASGSLKYIEAVEIDGDGSLEKMTNLVKQIEELKLNTSVKFTLKARKLGNLKARGVFFQNQLIVAEDVRDTSAIIHEIGHLIHLTRFEENKFVNYMIDKLTPMIELDDEISPTKENYYKKPTEVVARACEIAGLFAKEDGRLVIDDSNFEIIKSREFYTQYKGIYFNFTDFDKTTKDELLALFELFYETGPDEVVESRYDNFIKIDTQYTKTKKELSFYEMIKREQLKAIKELKALYALVNTQNINLIFSNRGNASIEELAKQILTNIKYCGNHKERMTAPEWMEVIENKSGVINFALDQVKKELSEKEWILFLYDLKKNAWSSIEREIFFYGFSDKFARALRKVFRENETPEHDVIVEFRTSVMSKNIGALLTPKFLADYELTKEILEKEPQAIKYINADYLSRDLLRNLNTVVLENSDNIRGYINPALGDDEEFMKYAVEKDRLAMTHTKELRNNKEFMLWFFETHGYENNLAFLGDSLKDDEVFAKPIVKENSTYLNFFTQRVQDLLDENPQERELKKLEGAKAGLRKKIAKETKSMKVLEILSKDKNYDVRAEVAKNEHTAYGTLLKLAKLKNRWVRTALASNKNTPESVITILSKEDDEYVLAELAKNIVVGQKQLLKLSKNKYRWVQWSVLQNPNIQNFKLPVKIHREIVGNCIRGDEEYFHHEIKSNSNFEGSFGFFDDLANNCEQYNLNDGFEEVFAKLAADIRDHKFKNDTENSKVETQAEGNTSIVTEDAARDFETLVEQDEAIDYSSLIEQGEVVDFERTDGKGVEKVLKIKAEIEDFRSFNQYMRSNKMGYYSRFAKGFILYEEYAKELLGKLSSDSKKAASVAATLYSADLLQNFANGTLF
ncbi:hypothetical protein [Sulfurimonas sp. NW9]|uniref:hypothetical protein n=1 Tax=Sulfurimonas sp. NW9 TaxID=2922728 RepID=UPI003DA8158F